MNQVGTYEYERNKYVRMFLSIILFDRDKFNLGYLSVPDNVITYDALINTVRLYYGITLYSVGGSYGGYIPSVLWLDNAVDDFPDVFHSTTIDDHPCLIVNADAAKMLEL